MAGFTHLDEKGGARMVDVSSKGETRREARAMGRVLMKKSTLEAIMGGGVEKGDVLGVARIAAIQAAKQTPNLIPLCHPLLLSEVKVDFKADEGLPGIVIEASVKLKGATGAEMEALTAVAVAGLTIYDMCKAVDRDMVVGEIDALGQLVARVGGHAASVHVDMGADVVNAVRNSP